VEPPVEQEGEVAPAVEVAEAAVTEAAVTEAAEIITTTEATGPSRFCKCVSLECSCCREFRLPVLPIASKGESATPTIGNLHELP
jgi:hypothetical protein